MSHSRCPRMGLIDRYILPRPGHTGSRRIAGSFATCLVLAGMD